MTALDEPRLDITANPVSAAANCALRVVEILNETLRANSTATLAISGGTTPRLLFADFVNSSLDWPRVHIFWVDERCVPPTDSESNFKLADEAWFKPANFPPGNLHRIFGELEPAEGARKYVAEIQDFFKLTDGGIPEFDVIHRGMGGDGHTASLFPGEPLIDNRSDIATGVWVAKFKMHRVTLLPAALQAARNTVLQVSGADKAEAVKNVLKGPESWMEYPCQIASRDSRASWFLDEAAAAKL